MKNTKGGDKSLARPWRKQPTANKLWIYSTYSPRSSIHFLARCPNFWKTLKKIPNIVRPTWSPRQQWLPRRKKTGDLPFVFSVQGTGGSSTVSDPENRVGDQDTGSTGRPISSGWLSEPGHCRARTRPPWSTSRGVFPSKCPSIAPAEMSNTPRWWFGPLEDNQWRGCRLDPKKSRRELFQRIFAHGIFLGRVEPLCRHSIDCYFVSES